MVEHTGLVDVVMLVLVGGDTNVGSASLSLALDGGVLVGGPLLVELGLVLRVHLLLVLSVNDGSGGSGVLGRKNLVVLYRLDSVLEVSPRLSNTRSGDLPGGGGCASLGRRPQRSRRAPEVGHAPERLRVRLRSRPRWCSPCGFPIN